MRLQVKDSLQFSVGDRNLRRSGISVWQAGSWLGAGALGALAMYFVDPQQGRGRRATSRDRMAAVFRARFRGLRRLSRATAAKACGLAQHVQHMEPEHWSVPNDATLAQRVKSELFRDPEIPKGHINVNAEAGIVVLRGEVDEPAEIRSIEQAVSRMPGVRGVHNLLHLPGMPAPDRGSVLPAP